MNVRLLAALLLADQELEELSRALKRNRDWRGARKLANARSHLARAIESQQQGVAKLVMQYVADP